jgi:hypothetical protein
LAYKKDILGANKEILKIAKGMDFDAMDPFQAEAFAKASGKTVAELQEMVQADKELNYIRMNGTVEQKAQLDKMQEMKRMRDVEAKDIGKQAELKLRQQANQERINQLQNQFNKLMMELAKPVMDVVEPFLKLATFILPPILSTFKYIAPYIYLMNTIAPAVERIGNALNALRYFSYVRDLGLPFAQSMKLAFSFFQGAQATNVIGFIGKITSIFGKMGSIGTLLLKTFGIVGKFMGPFGVILNIFTFITSLMKRWEETPKGILGGFQAIGGALYDTIIQPFVDAYNWIKNIFVGNSPSKLGMGMYNGIVSIGPALSDAITEPFKTGYNNISDLKLPIFNGVNNAVGTNIPTATTNAVSSNENVINQASIIGAIKQGIKEGIGSITMNVDLDGQKIITGISKNVGFRLDSGGVAMQTSLT